MCRNEYFDWMNKSDVYVTRHVIPLLDVVTKDKID